MKERSYFVVGFTYPKILVWTFTNLLIISIFFILGFHLGTKQSIVKLPAPKQELVTTPEVASSEVPEAQPSSTNIVSAEPIILETSTAKDEEEERERAKKELAIPAQEFALQIGSFSKREKAQSFLDKLAVSNPNFLKSSKIVQRKGKYSIQSQEGSDKESLQKMLSQLNLPDSVRKHSYIVSASKKS